MKTANKAHEFIPFDEHDTWPEFEPASAIRERAVVDSNRQAAGTELVAGFVTGLVVIGAVAMLLTAWRLG